MMIMFISSLRGWLFVLQVSDSTGRIYMGTFDVNLAVSTRLSHTPTISLENSSSLGEIQKYIMICFLSIFKINGLGWHFHCCSTISISYAAEPILYKS